MGAGLTAVLALRFATPVAWPWYTLVGSLTTLLAGSLAGLASRREAESVA
jgi:hypothetical protein